MVGAFFLFLTGNTLFGQICSKKSLSLNLLPGLIQICDVHFFSFRPKILCWANLVKKIKIDSLNWNLVCRPIWIAEFSGGVHFIWFSLKITFWGKFVPENQNCQFKLKFGTKTNLDMQNSVVLFTFSVFDWKYPFKARFILEAEVWYLEILNMQNS